jgi:hypothetical protein
MWFTTPKTCSSLCPWKTPPKSAREHGEAKIGGILIAQQQEKHTQQQEYLIDPLRASHVTYKELNLGGEDNNHSSQPPKLHPMEEIPLGVFFLDMYLMVKYFARCN